MNSQTVTQELSLTSGENKEVTFTFTDFKEVLGVTKISRPFEPNTQGSPYPSHQILDARYYQDYDPIKIIDNTVILYISNRTDTNSTATWSVTAIGK